MATLTTARAADCRIGSQATTPEMDTSDNNLCELCLRALTINDQLSGGAMRRNTADGTTTLDLSGFIHEIHKSRETHLSPFTTERQHLEPFRNRMTRVGDAGWIKTGDSYHGPRSRSCQSRWSCAGDQHHRLVTPPKMLEIPETADKICRLCSRLRTLFIERYASRSWWNEPGSALRFTIQYEWNEYREVLEGDDESTIPPSEQSLDGLAVLVICPGQDSNEADVYRFDVVALPGPCQQWLKIHNTPLDPDGPTSGRSIGFIRQRIDECIRNHPKCKKTIEPTFVPTRLLDVGNSSASSAKLIECNKSLYIPDPETQLQYATLSYCWGKSLTMRTTLANKSKHETAGIDINDMPATFRDAIYVAKKLEIRYLWIDALCIIQDDERDWEAEAVTMCDVFAYSKVTISAAKCSSSAEHFLQPPIEEILPVQFHSQLNPDISGQFFIRLEQQNVYPATLDVVGSAWISRAWVWQEALMSSRQVIFGNKTLQFRCSNGTFLEDGRYDGFFKPLHTSIPTFWPNGILNFSTKKLTYPSDRLKAVAGVAKFLQSSNIKEGKPIEYLAGLWRVDDFEVQLRWSCCRRLSSSYTELMELFQDKDNYIAPSWSWASRNASVDFHVNGTETAIRIVKTDLRASHQNVMVSVAFGSSITISGKIRRIPVEPSSGRLLKFTSRWPYKWGASSTFGRTDFWLDWRPKKHDEEERRVQQNLYLLLTTVIDMDECSAAGLVLAPVLDPATGVTFYYRVGTFIHRGRKEMFTSQREQELTIR